MGKTTRASMARRISFTDELLANVRQRYEQTDEPLSTMAADLGCCNTTLRKIAAREGWTRYVAPPRDLTPAARLLARAEVLLAGPPPAPLIPAEAGIQGQDRNASRLGPGSPLPRGRADDAMPTDAAGAPQELPPVANTVAELYAALVEALAEHKAARAKLKGKPQGQLERERSARTLANLVTTLHRLYPTLCAAPPSASDNVYGNDYDDFPADIDEFRNELARRIRAFFASRSDRDAGGDTDPPSVDAV